MRSTEIMAIALDVGFMVSTGYGQLPGQLMPVSDRGTLEAFAERIQAEAYEAGQREMRKQAVDRLISLMDKHEVCGFAFTLEELPIKPYGEQNG